MGYTRREYHTHNKEIQKYFDKLIQNTTVDIPTNIASEISRHKTIRNIRDMNHTDPLMLFGRDDKYHKTILHIRKPLRITKNGDRYEFHLE